MVTSQWEGDGRAGARKMGDRRASPLAGCSIATSKYGTDGSFIKLMLSVEVHQSSEVSAVRLRV